MLWHFFMMGSLAFYLLLLVFTLVVGFLFHEDKHGWSVFWTIMLFTALWLLGDFNLWQKFWANPFTSIGDAAFYFVVGGVWSIARWWFYVHKFMDRYKELRHDWMVRNGLEPDADIPLDKRAEFRDYMSNHTVDNQVVYKPPSPSTNKSKILGWIGFWPWSVIGIIFDDLARRIVDAIYNSLKGMYLYIANKVFIDTSRDMLPPE